MSRSFNLLAVAVLVAFGILLPVAFHLLGALGQVFLPMHIPVLVAGLVLGPQPGACVGLLTPVLGSLLTGMPPLLVLPVMAAELTVYGAAGGYFRRRRRLGVWVSLIAAMAAGRLAAALAAYVLQALFALGIKPMVYITGAVVTGLPGVAIQLMLVPLIVRRLQAMVNNTCRG